MNRKTLKKPDDASYKAHQNMGAGAIFIKLLKKNSDLSEKFKSRFLYFYLYYFNETFHAYEKHCFSYA